MLGVAGILLPEILTSAGLLNAPVWYNAGDADYSIPWTTLLAIEFLAFNFVELRRWQDIKNPGSTYEDPIFKGNKLPAGAFLACVENVGFLGIPTFLNANHTW